MHLQTLCGFNCKRKNNSSRNYAKKSGKRRTDMLKYFLKPLGCIDVVVIVLILIWFLLFVFNRNKILQIPVFIASHMLFYFSKMILNEGNFFIPSTIVLLVSFSAFIVFWKSKSKEVEKSSKRKWIYCFLTIALIVVVIFGYLLIEASSILMPPPH